MSDETELIRLRQLYAQAKEALAEEKESNEALIRENARLQHAFITPPPGWYVFGHHVDKPGISLTFWGTDGGGMPIWERPRIVGPL